MVSNDRQDKLLMEECIKHLTQYAAMITINRGTQGNESIERLRKIIGEMEAYWDLSDRRIAKSSLTKHCGVQSRQEERIGYQRNRKSPL